MTVFQQGDKVRCIDPGPNRHISTGKDYTVLRVLPMMRAYTTHTALEIVADNGKVQAYHTFRFEPYVEISAAPTTNTGARSTDPVTSKRASAKVKKVSIKSVMLDLLERYTAGLTGQEIAERTGYRLNSVTPRFAELQRQGKIKYASIDGVLMMRSGQIVWVLA